MKRLSLTVLTLGAICLTFQSAQATLLFSEGFDYSNIGGTLGATGNINPGSGAQWSGNSAITIASGSLAYPGFANVSPGANSLSVAWGVSSGSSINSPAFATAVSSGQIYYSFLLDMTALPSSTGSGAYLTAINKAGTSPGGSGDDVDLYVNNLGSVSIRSKGTYSTGTVLSSDTTYLVVLGLDFDGNTASIWVNPTPGGSLPTATASVTPGGTLDGVQDVGFKAQTSSTSGAFLIDDLRIGTDWTDVTPVGVPEPSTIAFAALGLVGLVARFRRR